MNPQEPKTINSPIIVSLLQVSNLDMHYSTNDNNYNVGDIGKSILYCSILQYNQFKLHYYTYNGFVVSINILYCTSREE
jgi:hypothetical protein